MEMPGTLSHSLSNEAFTTVLNVVFVQKRMAPSGGAERTFAFQLSDRIENYLFDL